MGVLIYSSLIIYHQCMFKPNEERSPTQTI